VIRIEPGHSTRNQLDEVTDKTSLRPRDGAA